MLTKRGFTPPNDWSFEQLSEKLKKLPKPAEPAVVATASTTTPTTTAPTKAEVVLPSSQRLDVQAPTINVHVPAPGVTINGAGKFSLGAAWNWVQAFLIGASFVKWAPLALATFGVVAP